MKLPIKNPRKSRGCIRLPGGTLDKIFLNILLDFQGMRLIIIAYFSRGSWIEKNIGLALSYRNFPDISATGKSLSAALMRIDFPFSITSPVISFLQTMFLK